MKKILLLLGLILSFALGVQAQDKIKVSGNVRDDKGEPLVGVQVIPQGATASGGLTDLDGNFQLNIPKTVKTLSFSYVGFERRTVAVNGSAPLRIVLREVTSAIDEVVVTGYGGKVRRNQVTNSISTVKKEALSVGVFANPAQALSGAVPGVRVQQVSGNPGAQPSIVIRGGTNLDGSGAPLVVVDGQLRASMADINPEDIEDMQVLKDAGATAIYGARASNGVILITTKTGKAGVSSFNVKVRAGWDFFHQANTFLSADRYLYWQRLAHERTAAMAPMHAARLRRFLSTATPFGTGNVYGNSTNNVMAYDANSTLHADLLTKGWALMADPVVQGQQLIYRGITPSDYSINSPALTQDYNISMQGGNDRGVYYAGIGYNNQEGLAVTSYYKRYNFLFNGSYKIKPWLKSSSNFSFNRANWQSMPGSAANETQYFGRAFSTPPTSRFIDEEGNNLLGPGIQDGNHLFQPEKWQRFNQTDKFTMVQTFDIDLGKLFALKLSANWLYSEAFSESFLRDRLRNMLNNDYDRTRSSSASFTRDWRQTYTATLNYSQSFKKHKVDALLGTEYLDVQDYGFSAAGQGAVTDEYADLELTTPDANKRSIDSEHSEWRILSFLGRANYSYDGKYLASFVFRNDGYSTLLGANRWGFFPGVSAGWVFTQESWAKDALSFLSFGKLRASYGVNGNASGIDPYELQGRYALQGLYNGKQTYLISGLPNPDLRWEKTTTREVGLDLGFFKNKLNVNLTYYNRLTSDKYAQRTLTPTSGFTSIRSNNGELRNQGIELEVSARLLQTKDWSWNAGFNVGYNKNTVVSLPYKKDAPRNQQGAALVYTGSSHTNASGQIEYDMDYIGGYQEGQEPNQIVVYKYLGMYRSDDEVPGDLVVETGNPSGFKLYGPAKYNALSAKEKETALPIKAGDAIWQDVNGDGKIDQYDRVLLGSSVPRVTGGFNTTLRYKGLQLYVRTDFALGHWVLDESTAWIMGNYQGTYNTTTLTEDSFTEDNPNASYPRYLWFDQAGNYRSGSTLFAYRGDYLALRELSLSYSLPKHWAKKVFCQDITLSVTGQNLGYLSAATKTITVPEASTGGGGADRYPIPRKLLLGLNVTF